MSSTISTALRGLAGVLALGVVTLMGAPAAMAAPSLDVSETTGLSSGQKITVNGSGFEPGLKSIAVGQCKEGMKGPSDCDLQGGATFVNADDSGKIPTVNLTLSESFNGIDCLKQQCVVGAAPLPNAASEDVVSANSVFVNLTFGSADTGADAPADTTAPAAPAPTTAAPTAAAPADNSALPKTGGTDSLPVLVLAAAALLLPGAAVLLWMPGRRRQEARS